MPMILIEGPPGLSDVAKKRMVSDVTRAADEAYPVPDVRVWLREDPRELYPRRCDRRPVRPIATLEGPKLGKQRVRPEIVAAARQLGG